MKKLPLLLGVLIMSGMAQAATTDIGVGVSTLGGQLTFNNKISDEFSLRLQFNGFKYN